MKGFQRLNLIVGWGVFLFALIVYMLTLEPTTSFWDCGEFIAAAYKLEVVHPPGSPMHALIGRFFSMFAPSAGDVAYMLNTLSAIASAFTIAFMFWSLTYFIRKFYNKGQQYSGTDSFMVLASAAIGAVSASFLDSFWFSAVEGEVYALSAFFFFAMVWAMVRWDAYADSRYADRWLLFIALLCGLGVGVHLLHLLTIPALALIYYLRKYKPTVKGGILAIVIGSGVLAFVMWGVLDYFVRIAEKLDIMFVNGFNLPIDSGVYFFLVLVLGIVGYFIYYANKKNLRGLQTGLLAFVMLIIGFSSYSVVMSRAQANPPINMNEPADISRLHSYLKREQYGSRPLLYGPYFTAQPLDQKVTGTRYQADFEKNEYIEIGEKTEYVYDVDEVESGIRNSIRQRNPNASEAQIEQQLQRYRERNKMTIFPRMGSITRGDHARQYRKWLDLDENKVPDFGDNLRFFVDYQLGYMYFRYFMWNFSGRQDNIQGHIDRGLRNGNWLTGIRPIDKMRLGGTKLDDPESKNNKARNNFYMLPFILGLLGLFYHFSKDKKTFAIVATLFFFSGVMLIVNSNQPPSEPRERHYAVALSFVTYCMWIGIGVLAVFDMLRKNLNKRTSAAVATAACLVVPILLGWQGWDDHDRSGRYVARDSAVNYLKSLDKNAVLFTQGDNDTYPLWYAQEVEGIRPDVRIVNLSLLAVDWYINQLKNRINDAPPLKLRFDKEDYMGDNLIQTRVNASQRFIEQYGNDLGTALDYVKQNAGNQRGRFLPLRNFKVPFDSANAASAGVIPEDFAQHTVPALNGKVKGGSIFRDDMIIMDLIASNFPERPFYYSITVDPSKHLGMGKYMQREGLAYRLTGVQPPGNSGSSGYVNTDLMYKNITETWEWGGLDQKEFFMEEWTDRTTRMMRGNLIFLANVIQNEGGDPEKVKHLIELVWDKFPTYNVPFYDPQELYPLVNLAMEVDADSMAPVVTNELADVLETDISYHYEAGDMERERMSYGGGARDFLFNVRQNQSRTLSSHGQQLLRSVSLINNIVNLANNNGNEELANEFKSRIEAIEDKYDMQLMNQDMIDGGNPGSTPVPEPPSGPSQDRMEGGNPGAGS